MDKFSVEDKLQAVRGWPCVEKSITKRYGVSVSILSQWLERYRIHGEQGLRKRQTNHPSV
ncbi:helix-turn-helix domain-containing protein [Planococcus kocurii]|uniref:helix-turn-helix domain-containing protein n=1 Tax=Planococcus TaxID=1372 RepID=UPI0011ED8D28|nr:helix-turn-helix domain-containing protein [Planococcus sp. ANT_H30]